MEEEDIIDMECDGTKFCVSEVTQEVALYGLQMTVQAWNTHVIHGSFFNYVSNHTSSSMTTHQFVERKLHAAAGRIAKNTLVIF